MPVGVDAIDLRSSAAVLSGPALATVESLGRIRVYPASSTLFRQEERTRHVAILTQSWVKVVASARNGQEAFLAVRGPGDVLGELSAGGNRTTRLPRSRPDSLPSPELLSP